MKPIHRLISSAAIILITTLALSQVATIRPDSPNQTLAVKGQATVISMRKLVASLSSFLRQQELQLADAQAHLDKAKAQDPKGETGLYEGKVAEIQASIGRARFEMVQARQFLAVTKTMSVEGKNVRILDLPVLLTVPNAEHSVVAPVTAADLVDPGIKITIDPRVPNDLTVDLNFQDEPLGAIIETIAQKSGLSISMEHDGSLKLIPSVAGHSNDYPWPWVGVKAVEGLEYGHTIYPVVGVGERWIYLAGVLNNSNITREPNIPSVDKPSVFDSNGFDSDAFTTPIVISREIQPAPAGPPIVVGLGKDMLVVGEPGVNAKGAKGLWLTLYRCKNGKLTQVNQVFHVGAMDRSAIQAVKTVKVLPKASRTPRNPKR
jgi:hypothetical protein